MIRFVRAALIVVACFVASAAPAAPPAVDAQSRREALQHYFEGQQLLAGERYDQAADEFRKAVAVDPLLAGAHYGLGQANVGMRLYVSAIKAYGQCIEACRALHGLAQQTRFLRERQRDEYLRERRSQQGTAPFAQAEAWIERVERSRTPLTTPFRPPAEVLLALGSAYFRNGDRELAEFEWKVAIDIDPKLGAAYNNLAVLYLQDGRRRDALAAVKSAERGGYQVNPQVKDDIAVLADASR